MNYIIALLLTISGISGIYRRRNRTVYIGLLWLGLALFGLILLTEPTLTKHPLSHFIFTNLGRFVGVIGPIFMLVLGLSMISYGLSLFSKERNRLGLVLVELIGLVLVVFGILGILGLFLGRFFARNWLELPYFVLAYYSLQYFYYLWRMHYLNHQPLSKTYDYILVLGASLTRDGGVTNLLGQRLNTAIKLYQQRTVPIIVSGKQKNSRLTSEAQAMAFYLERQGVAKKDIRLEKQADNTHENMFFAKEIMDKEMRSDQAQVAIVSSNFHLPRASIYAELSGIKNYQMVGSPTSSKAFLFHQMRDFVAVLFMHRKLHFMMTILALVFGFVSVYRY